MPKPTPVRIDADLYEALVKVAAKYRRSVTAQVNSDLWFIIETSHEWALPKEEETK